MRQWFRCSLLFIAASSLAVAATPEEQALEPYRPPAAPPASAWPRERLLAFMKELVEFVEKNHVVTDPAHKTYGMVYEYWKAGQKMQDYGPDAMDDGARWMSALVTAQRADTQGDWLERAQRYQVPFFTNALNHSDDLFPQMQPTEDDKQPWNNPIKGWVPRGWDDGSGWDRKTGKALPNGYATGSNQLSQNVADALLNVWLTTRDPRVTEALGHLRDYKQQCFGGLPGVDIAAAISAGQADGFLKYRLPEFSPQALTPYYPGLYEKKAARLPSTDDALAWIYRQGTAGALIAGEMPRSATALATARCYAAWEAMETFFDDRPAALGQWFFDLQPSPGFVEGKGRLEEYDSTPNAKRLYGPQGAELAAVAAGVLPELKATPVLWDGLRKWTGPVVRMVDEAPTTDGVKDPVYEGTAALGDDTARVTLLSDPKNLHVFIETTRPQVTILFQEETGEQRPGKLTENAWPERTSKDLVAKPKSKSSSASSQKKKGSGSDASKSSRSKRTSDKAKETKADPPPPPEPPLGRGGKLVIDREGTSKVVNERGETLLAVVACKPGEFQQGEGFSWTAEVRIPYTHVPAQKAWINGVDFGRYKVNIDAAPAQSVMVMSEAKRVQRRLETGVLATIDQWYDVWKQTGIIPAAWSPEAGRAGEWAISDAGGYACLLKTMALWMIYQDGHREWEIVRDQFPNNPRPAPSLPETVIKAQGLDRLLLERNAK